MLQEFIHWIAHTSASRAIANADWVIPAFQTVHILAIAVVVSTMGMLDLRLLGWAGRRYTLRATVDRYLPWMWIAVIVLLCTGAVLITGEPERSLGNWVFQVKMGLLASVLVVTVGFRAWLERHVDGWERGVESGGVAPGSGGVPPLAAQLTGAVSLLLWVGIVVAGRWIAYVS